MAMTATVLSTPAAMAATAEATESVKLTPLDPLAVMEETLVAATVETLAAEGVAEASISPTLVMGVAEETTVEEQTKEDTVDFHQAVDPMAVAQALVAMEATLSVMEVAQAMAVTANVQPTQNHGVRTLGHQAMEETLAPTVEGH